MSFPIAYFGCISSVIARSVINNNTGLYVIAIDIEAHRDGTIENIKGNILPVRAFRGNETVLRSHFGYFHLILDAERHLILDRYGKSEKVFPDDPVIESFAISDRYDDSTPLILVVAEY